MSYAGSRALTLILCLVVARVGYASVCPQPEVTDSRAAMMWRRLAAASVGGVYNRPVRLSQGQFGGEPFVPGAQARPELRLWPELFRTGDLDGRAGEEIVGILSETSGGSGERVYLLAADVFGEALATLPAYLIGDRVKVRALKIEERKIIIDIVEAGAQEPLCCGTALARLVFTVEPQGLRLSEKRSQGRLSLKILEGSSWRLVENGFMGTQADAYCKTLAIRGEQIAVQIGDRTYVGKIVESAPGQIAISQLTGDAMDRDELLYLTHLASVARYTFLAGRLTLTGRDAGRSILLKFAPAAGSK